MPALGRCKCKNNAMNVGTNMLTESSWIIQNPQLKLDLCANIFIKPFLILLLSAISLFFFHFLQKNIFLSSGKRSVYWKNIVVKPQHSSCVSAQNCLKLNDLKQPSKQKWKADYAFTASSDLTQSWLLITLLALLDWRVWELHFQIHDMCPSLTPTGFF